MSVPTWKRTENELNLFVEAQEFAVHILKITFNEKIFKKEFKVSITDRLNQLAYTHIAHSEISKTLG